MNYQLENLGPERFQMLAQSLIVSAFPDAQCLPVGQPDGGRDAMIWSGQEKQPLVVFQVKFARVPHSIESPQEWLLSTIEPELPKITRLAERGAKQYVIICNVSGTAHLDKGKIDSLHSTLSELIPIPALCWWRDDVNRRLDDAWNVKWAYPDILSGPDLLRAVFESHGNDRARRERTIKAFLREDFEREREVKFRQVELENALFELFVDVPLQIPNYREESWRRSSRTADHYLVYTVLRENILAASALLGDDPHSLFQQVVLEGAPGQGKSTIVQYISQLHRARLLDEPLDASLIPSEHLSSALRLPIKADLRDLSTWLDRRNPFSADGEVVTAPGWQRTLESFLAALISDRSGGARFDVDDLTSTIGETPTLIVLDGLDEVAEISKRQSIVQEITRGVSRLSENCTNLQVIATSRPSAFLNSPGLSSKKFHYLELGPLRDSDLTDYAERWLKAKRLHGREARDVRQTLKQKIAEPHLKELARNPMQLAIVLSLINTRGVSLPDKRTALYDNYVDLFFSRESEKSAIVREHRELLRDIHCYLAWVLHGEAERAGGRGSITEERLRDVVQEFLHTQGHDTSLIDDLFTGVIERVVALVSRVEGTFEFEVQPLREYFAARHLYDTAPYTPVGDETAGTRPERFDAVARNFYWTNVARFYAGCYNRGELPSLVEGLEELVEDEEYRYTNHPHVLAATLLSDWVFAQLPRSQSKVVELVLTPMGLRHMLNETALGRMRSEPIALPKRCGGAELLQRALDLLVEAKTLDQAHSLIRLLVKNGTTEDLADAWKQIDYSKKLSPERYLEIAFQLEVLPHFSNDELDDICGGSSRSSWQCRTLLRGRKFGYIAERPELIQASVNVLFDGASVSPIRNRGHLFELAWMLASVQCYIGLVGVRNWGAESVRHALMDTMHRGAEKVATEAEALGEVGQKLVRFVDAGRELFGRGSSVAIESQDGFRALIDVGVQQFGQRRALSKLAVFFAGARLRGRSSREVHELTSDSVSLVNRALGARYRAGNAAWWRRQVVSGIGNDQAYFVALCMIVWAGPTVMVKCQEDLTKLIESLDSGAQQALVFAARELLMDAGFGRERVIKSHHGLESKHWRGAAAAVVCLRGSESVCEAVIRQNEGSIFDNGRVVGSVLLTTALEVFTGKDSGEWKKKLVLVEEGRKHGIAANRWLAPGHREKIANGLPEDVAMRIIEEAEKYPSTLVAIAEDVCRRRVVKGIQPVLERAQANGWG